MEGSCYFGKVLDEPVVEIAEADELPDGFDITGWLPIMYCLHFDTFHFESIGG